jgi:HEPN domain-containing protein
MRQAKRDLQSARAQREDGFYEWSCFIAQQAAEKAVKAAFFALGSEAWGHSLLELLEGLGHLADIPSNLSQAARGLDRYYIPARYPNGWASGTPADYVTEEDADEAIGCSEAILRVCHRILSRSEPAQEENPQGDP